MEPRQKTSSERVYEDLQPTMEWHKEPTADTLMIYLPGFRKEQLKVQVTTSRFLRVSGERLLSDNKWVQYRKDIPIPSNYDTNEISAMFERGVLHIKHPKINSVQDPEPPQEKIYQQALTEAPKPQEEKSAQPIKEATKPPQEKSLPPEKPSQKQPQEKVQQQKQQPAPKPPQKPPPPVEQHKMPSRPEKIPSRNNMKQQMESLKPEKPTSETQVEGASKIGMDRQNSGKRGDSSEVLQKMFEKEKELGKYEQKDKSNEMIISGNNARKVTTSPEKQENVSEPVKDSGEIDKHKATTDISCKLASENHKQVLRDGVTDLKNPRKLLNSVLVALQVLVLSLYVMITKVIRSLWKSKKQYS